MLLMKYESIKLVTLEPKNRWRNGRNLVITDDEEEERPAMKQEH